MSSPIDLGSEWREVTIEEWRSDDVPKDPDTAYLRLAGEDHYFFRVKPVPPLPTELYTVIRVTWPNGATNDMTLYPQGWNGPFSLLSPTALAKLITGFEVLAEPVRKHTLTFSSDRVRRETAKAVLDRARFLRLNTLSDWPEMADTLAREFGVDA